MLIPGDMIFTSSLPQIPGWVCTWVSLKQVVILFCFGALILWTHYTAASYRTHRHRTNSSFLKRCFWLSVIVRSALTDCKKHLTTLLKRYAADPPDSPITHRITSIVEDKTCEGRPPKIGLIPSSVRSCKHEHSCHPTYFDITNEKCPQSPCRVVEKNWPHM